MTSEARLDEALIEQALAVLPEIGRRAFAHVAGDAVSDGRPVAQMKAIAHLARHGRQPVKEVAAALGISMPATSELVERMVDDGMVVRETNPADRRQVLVALTPRAEELGRRFHALRRAQVCHALAQLEPHERPIFVRSLRAWADALATDPRELLGCGDQPASRT